MRLKALVVLVAVVAVAAVALALSAGGTRHNSTNTNSTKSTSASSSSAASSAASETQAFLTHAGLAFGTFYRFIWGPYTKGEFRLVPANKATLARASAAGLYVATQLKLASAAASADHSLAALAPPVKTLSEGFQSAVARVRKGEFKLSEIQTANVAIGAIKGAAAQGGLTIPESTPSTL